MISNLHIQNIGIIDDISINLNKGLNVLTGETGAGKTLIIDSLLIIAGGRFSKEMIRKGQEYSFVEMCLYLPNYQNSDNGNIIVSREIFNTGRNLCKINGRMVTVNELKEFMQDIINIHGQLDNQTILDSSSHIQYLDEFSKNEELTKIKEEYHIQYEEYCKLKQELKQNYGDDKEKQRKLDLLKYQLNEIEEAHLKIEEEEQLDNIRTKILHSEKISEGLKEVDIEVGEHAIDSISNAIKALEKIENLDSSYEEKLNNLKSIYYDLQELSRDISILKEDIEFDEEERQKVEIRLDLIFSLKRKYGNTIEDILKYKEEIQNQIKQIENLEEYRESLKIKIEELDFSMLKLSKQMNIIRQNQAEILSTKISQELQDLEMKQSSFLVQVMFDEKKDFHKNGLDKVEFLIKTNKGEDFKPLIKIASGGEMSRIMLAIKNILACVDKVPVLVFDEIDTGISGIAANRVAKKMKQIAKHHQVLCVTHLAPIAASGDYNYNIYKTIENEITKTNINLLNEEGTIYEIARIASGTITDIALEHARQLKQEHQN